MIDKWVVEFLANNTDYSLELDQREFPQLKNEKAVKKDVIKGLSEMGRSLQSTVSITKKYLQ